MKLKISHFPKQAHLEVFRYLHGFPVKQVYLTWLPCSVVQLKWNGNTAAATSDLIIIFMLQENRELQRKLASLPAAVGKEVCERINIKTELWHTLLCNQRHQKIMKIKLGRSPSLGVCNYPIFLSRRFHRPIYFQLELISNSEIPKGTSVTNSSHKHRLMLTYRLMSTCSREAVLFYPYRSVLMQTGTGLFCETKI